MVDYVLDEEPENFHSVLSLRMVKSLNMSAPCLTSKMRIMMDCSLSHLVVVRVL